MRGANNMSNEMAPRSRGWRNQAIAVVALAAALCAGWAQAALTEVYRFYHLDAGRHFYTASAAERDKVLNSFPRFAYEGVAFFAYPTQDPGTIPVHRFYHSGNGSHVYTASEAEKTSILTNFPVYSYEGVAFYAEASAASGAMPLYRLYNSKLGTHFFTTSGAEANTAVSTWAWFANEGPVFFVRPGPGQPGSGLNIAPTASLSVATTQVNVGEMVNLAATASDPDGTVAKVDYFAGANKVGTTTAAPHTFAYVATAAGNVVFSAVATDNAGLSGASNSVMVSVFLPGAGPPILPPPTGNTPPSVSLTTSSTSVAAGTPVTLTANATDAGGSVSRVIFYNGPTQIDVDMSAPFTTTFTPSGAGTFSFSAVAVDNQNAQSTSNTVMVTATAGTPGGPNTSPTVSLVTSTGNMSVGGTALLTASAADADGSVTKVEFFEGTSLIGTATTSPFTSTFSPIAKGNFAFKAIATDNKGAKTTSNTVTIFVASTGGGNQPPTVSLAASPTSVASGAVSVLTATAADSDGTVAKVLFFDGASLLGQATTAPFKINFTSGIAGPHSITAIAYDNKDATTTSNSVTVTVSTSTNKSPTVSLAASPTTVATGVTSTLTATAADSDGSISKVVFYNGATMLGQVTTAPYTYAFSSATAGTFTLTAIAFDNLNAQTTSSGVVVTVNTGGGGANKAPTVSLAASPMTVTVGSSTTLTATAADSDGSISNVVFMNGTTVLSTDATAPYSFVWTPAAAGTFSLTAVATDNLGAKTTSTAITVTASTATATSGLPRISLALSATLVAAPATITLTGTATATATGATVTRVSFYMNGAKLIDDTATPFTTTATINNPGTYTFYATVTDSLGSTVSTLTQVVTAGVPTAINTTSADTWRLLNQATFGATQAEAARVNSLGVSGWIDDQIAKPISGYPDAKYNKIQLGTSLDCTTTMPGGGNYPGDSPQAICNRDQLTLAGIQRDFFTNAISGQDQLRQRVAWALSQILVTSANEQDLSFAHVMSRYQNLMFQEAFGNYETLLQKVTYNPAMGNYLDAVNNDRPSGTRVPNENYAREILQLFTIGLDELNANGTKILDAGGMPVPTYDQTDIAEFARVFTGYTYANAAGTAATGKQGTTTARRWCRTRPRARRVTIPTPRRC